MFLLHLLGGPGKVNFIVWCASIVNVPIIVTARSWKGYFLEYGAFPDFHGGLMRRSCKEWYVMH